MSLFKRPAWAKQQAPTSDDLEEHTEQSIFSHSTRSFDQIFAEEQKRKQAQAERQAKRERFSPEKGGGSGEGSGGSKRRRSGEDGAKRRRITLEEGSELLREVGLSADVEGQEEGGGEGQGVESVVVSTSPRRNKVVRSEGQRVENVQRAGRQQDVVELSDGSGDEEEQPHPTIQPREEVGEEDSDDEFVRIAREARARRLEQQSLENESRSPEIAAEFTSFHREPSATSAAASLPTPPPRPPPDPIVQLFVDSPIQGTTSLVVHRKLSQRVKEIREVWCGRQQFPPGITSDQIFLIYRMRKIYDVTTCKSLGLQVDEDGSVYATGPEDDEITDKVHLIAVTEPVFAQMKADKAAGERHELEGDFDADDEQSAAAQAAPQESLIRILLKAKGKSDYKLKVKPVCILLDYDNRAALTMTYSRRSYPRS